MRNFNYVLVCSLLLGACAVEDEELIAADEHEGVDAPADALGVQSEAGPQAAPIYTLTDVIDCPTARVIGILDDPKADSCDLDEMVPSSWVWKTMFEEGSPGVAGLADAPPDELRRYCMYEYQNGLPELHEYQSLLQAIDQHPGMRIESIASDCRGEFAQGDLLDSEVGVALHDAFRANIDWVSSDALGVTSEKRLPVAISVVDTVSQHAVDNAITPANAHGLFMAAMIGDIACPDSDPACTQWIDHTLAMPRNDWASGPDWVVGGQHGTQGDTALAIYEAVERWRETNVADPLNAPVRLVLNLSLGWERVTQYTNDPTRGPSASLQAALQYASCQGALVFVAAGNNSDEGCPEDHVGPLAPASFEELEAPSEQECVALGFASAEPGRLPAFDQSPRPLVYAVGGVDEHDRSLINARLGGRPRLAAMGANGTVVIGNQNTEPLTGSSVATAVVSGAAALVWSYRPELTPDEVVNILYTTGWNTGDWADFDLSGSGPAIRRVSVCAALDAACNGMPAIQCPDLGCTAKAPASDGNLSSFFSAVADVMADPTTVIKQFPAEPAATPVCEDRPMTELADPQPEYPICSRCNMYVPSGTSPSDDVVYMSIDPIYKGQVTAVTLITYDATSNPTSYNLGAAIVGSINDPSTNVTKALVDAPFAASAALEFTLADGSSQSNSIAIDRG